MTAISNRQPEVYIHYDTAAGRTSKHFTDAYAARRFYTAKDKLGKNPRVSKDPHFEELEMSNVTTTTDAAVATTPAKAAKPKRTARKTASRKANTPANRAKARKAAGKEPAPKKKAPAKGKGKAKAAPKASANGKVSRGKGFEGLTGNQIKVLECLAKKDEQTRDQMIKTTGITGGWSRMLGAATKDGFGVQGSEAQAQLEPSGYVKSTQARDNKGEPLGRMLAYTITKKGRQLLARKAKADAK